jgi:hypothetical protein
MNCCSRPMISVGIFASDRSWSLPFCGLTAAGPIRERRTTRKAPSGPGHTLLDQRRPEVGLAAMRFHEALELKTAH